MTTPRNTAPDFDHAWEEIKAHNLDEAERIFAEAAHADPACVDAWNGLGAVQFERGDLNGSTAAYHKAHAAAVEARQGRLPSRLAWSVPEDRAALRSIHGLGLNHYRAGRLAEAKREFETLLKLNPEDNQGARFLLKDVERKAGLWKKDS